MTGHEDLEQVVDLQDLPLRGVVVDEGAAHIGALTTLTELLEADLPPALAALAEAAAAEHNGPVRNASTIGGRLCRDRADARLLTALVALDAEVALVERGAGEQRVQVEAFAGSEWQQDKRGTYVVTAVHVPVRAGRSGYRDFAMTAVDTPYADAAAFVGEGVLRVAVGGLGATASGVVRAGAAEDAGDGEGWQVAVREGLEPALPSWTTPRASGDYRRDVATTLVIRLLEALRREEAGA